jgi:hypothetical protein
MNDAETQYEDWQRTHGITTLKKLRVVPFLREQDGVLCLRGKQPFAVYPLSSDSVVARRAAQIIFAKETQRSHAGETRPTNDGKS